MVWKPHSTVAAVIERDNKFLMVEELIDGQPVLNQPAGHLEDSESMLQAIVREVKEETAWDFTPRGIVGVYRWRHPAKLHTYMRTSFFGEVGNHDSSQKLDSVIISADWYNRSELENMNLRSPMVLRNIDDYLSGKNHPLELLQDV